MKHPMFLLWLGINITVVLLLMIVNSAQKNSQDALAVLPFDVIAVVLLILFNASWALTMLFRWLF